MAAGSSVGANTATTNLTDPATASVGTGSMLSAPWGTLLVQSQTATDANAASTSDDRGLGASSSATSNTTVTSDATTEVTGAGLSARIVDVKATGGDRSAQANAKATLRAAGGKTTATTNLTATNNSSVQISGAATLTGTDGVDISSDSGTITADSSPTTDAIALGP